MWIFFRQLFLEPGMGASDGEEMHTVLENPLTVSVSTAWKLHLFGHIHRFDTHEYTFDKTVYCYSFWAGAVKSGRKLGQKWHMLTKCWSFMVTRNWQKCVNRLLTFSKVSTGAGVRLLNWKKSTWKDTILIQSFRGWCLTMAMVITIITTRGQKGGSSSSSSSSSSALLAFLLYTDPADDEVIDDDSEERR